MKDMEEVLLGCLQVKGHMAGEMTTEVGEREGEEDRERVAAT